MATVLNDHNVDGKIPKKTKSSFPIRNLRLCLKYRPEIFRLILKMQQCIKRKNTILKRLKKQLKLLTNSEAIESKNTTNDKKDISRKLNLKETWTQTENFDVKDSKEEIKGAENETKASEWKFNTGEEKSIADQVKEVAQSAIQESGMVYVESAGMYYDYKTGYYYNSELGLYYHTDTGCYYYYSEEKQNFVFHSYPDRSALVANAPLIMHSMKKLKKHKKEKEEDAHQESRKRKRTKVDRKEETPKIKKHHEENNCEDKKTNETENIELEAKNCKEVGGSVKPVSEPSKEESSKEEFGKEDENDLEDNNLEDGECSESNSDDETQIENDEDMISNNSTSTATDDESVARQHPPCMRLIVRETNLSKLKVGNLFLVTKDGGTIGREGEQHAIVIADTNVSRNHLDIKYDLGRNIYLATDLGSKNGTILNGVRMSASQDISMPMEVAHGSVLQLGETKLLCHIHPGNDTCGHCEPGLIMETADKGRKVAYTRTCNVQKQHQLELARLKNKYAPKPLAIEAEAYNDRAKTRRDTVGSSHHAEKTQSSDIDSFIPSENKGFKLLEKMGWSKGEGLGKDGQGEKEPIPLVSNEGKAGLGTSNSTPVYQAPTSNLGPATLRLAARTKMLQPPAKAFQNPEEYESE